LKPSLIKYGTKVQAKQHKKYVKLQKCEVKKLKINRIESKVEI